VINHDLFFVVFEFAMVGMKGTTRPQELNLSKLLKSCRKPQFVVNKKGFHGLKLWLGRFFSGTHITYIQFTAIRQLTIVIPTEHNTGITRNSFFELSQENNPPLNGIFITPLIWSMGIDYVTRSVGNDNTNNYVPVSVHNNGNIITTDTNFVFAIDEAMGYWC
jgi:hypothetical protein